MKNDLNGGISSVSPISSFSIMETCSGVTTAFAMTSPSLFFLIGIDSDSFVFSGLTFCSKSLSLTVSFLGNEDALVKLVNGKNGFQ